MMIKKIKITETTTIQYYETVMNTEKASSVKCPRPPVPAFLADCREFGRYTFEAIDLPADWKGSVQISITEFAFRYVENGSFGVVLTFVKKVDNYKTPMVIKSPVLWEGSLPPDMVNKIFQIQQHAKDFINGKRAQRDMIDDVTLDGSHVKNGQIIVDFSTGEIL